MSKKQVITALISVFYAGASSMMIYHFGWLSGGYLVLWVLVIIAGMVKLFENPHSNVSYRITQAGILLNSGGLWLFGMEVMPLLTIFGMLAFFGSVILHVASGNESRAKQNGLIGLLFFLSVMLGPRFGPHSLVLVYGDAVYLVVVGCVVVVIGLLRRFLLRSVKFIAKEKLERQHAVEAKNWYVESFGMVVHNIKSPLTTILNRLEISRLKSNEAGEVTLTAKQQEQMLNSAIEISELLQQFLNIHRNAHEFATEEGELTLDLLVRRIAENTGATLKSNGKTSDYVLSEVEVFALQQALDVLIDNSRKYAGHMPEVELAGTTVIVSDHGPGLTDDQAAQFGSELMRSKSELGSGIGVYFASRILNKSGWKMRIGDHKGGLTIVISQLGPEAIVKAQLKEKEEA